MICIVIMGFHLQVRTGHKPLSNWNWMGNLWLETERLQIMDYAITCAHDHNGLCYKSMGMLVFQGVHETAIHTTITWEVKSGLAYCYVQ